MTEWRPIDAHSGEEWKPIVIAGFIEGVDRVGISAISRKCAGDV